MDNLNQKKELKKLVKGNKVYTVIFIISVVLTLILSYYSYYISKKDLPETTYATYTDNENDFVDFNVEFLTDAYATYTVDDSTVDSYYLAMDENNTMCVLKIDNKDLYKFDDIIKYSYGEIDEKPEAVKIYGTYAKTPSELRDLTLEFYNKIYPDYEIYSSDYNSYFGSCYINTFDTPYTDSADMSLGFIFIGGTFIIVFGMITLIYKINTNRTINTLIKNNKLDEVYNSLKNVDAENFEEQNVILTDKYIIDCNRYLKIVEYSDIIWIYLHIQRYNGVEVSKNINVLLKNRKTVSISPNKTSGKNYEILKELLAKICTKCPNALVGYTHENIKATNRKNFNETVQEIERKNLNI